VFLFGEGVKHVHYHFLPRYLGAPIEFRGTKVYEWKDAPHGDYKKTIEYCLELTRFFIVAKDKRIRFGINIRNLIITLIYLIALVPFLDSSIGQYYHLN
jgi:hypothetical protein